MCLLLKVQIRDSAYLYQYTSYKAEYALNYLKN